MGAGDNKSLPFGEIDAQLYDVMIERCHHALRIFFEDTDKKSSEYFKDNFLKPHFLAAKPLQEYTVLLLNTGLLQNFTKTIANKALTLPQTAVDFTFNSEFLSEKDWGDRELVRSDTSFSMPESVYLKALQISQEHPFIVKALHIIQTISDSHLENMRQRLCANNHTEVMAYPGYQMVEETLNNLLNSSVHSFTYELSPYVSLASAGSEQPVEHIFARGLAHAFHSKAFTVREPKRDKIVECPFSSQIGHLWNTDIILDSKGIYKISPEKRAGAFPALIAKLITDETLKPEYTALSACPYSTRKP